MPIMESLRINTAVLLFAASNPLKVTFKDSSFVLMFFSYYIL